MRRIRYILVILIPLAGIVIYMNISNKNINEIGLQLFQFVKKIKGDQVDFKRLNRKVTIPVDHDIWDQLLKRYVDEKGMVNYLGFQKDEDRLDSYLSVLRNNPPSVQWTNNEKMAYWINAYNALTVKLILNHYPVRSIKEIAGGLPMINSPWDIKFFKIGDVDFDLNTIEHEILRKEFNESRIHFAINCASISCPTLRKEAYTAEKLEVQLEDQARIFINDTTRNVIRRDKIQLSEIFNWFNSDFTRSTSLADYIKNYTQQSINANASIEFLEYNWGINDLKQ